MAKPVTLEFSDGGKVPMESLFHPSSSSGGDAVVSTSQQSQSSQSISSTQATTGNQSSTNGLSSSCRARLPSYCNLEGTTGLQPSRKPFDMGVIKRLDHDFDETTIEPLEDEKLKTFLRIRPSSCVPGFDQKSKSGKKNQKKNRVLEVKDETTVLVNPLQKFVDSSRGGRSRAVKKTEFKFSKVLGPECSQTTVFEECVNPLIEQFLKNENSLVFTYGATNSGKTYTLQGYGSSYGIIPRTLDAIFSRIQGRLYKQGDFKPYMYRECYHLRPQEIEVLQRKKEEILQEVANIKNEPMRHKSDSSFAESQVSSQGSTVNFVGVGDCSEFNYALFANTTMFSVWVSFAELYNDKVYDLLETINVGKSKRRKERKLLQDRSGFVYIKDLTELSVCSDDEAYKIFLAGRKNLQFAATQMNERSSRSHSFFTIRVVSIKIGENLTPYSTLVHRMTFCDLAGMERASQTENDGVRLKESSNINSSLTVLLKVIRLLREKQAHGNRAIETIPFRESKLTHIFKSYLTSSTHICMIVNVNPDPRMAASTLQVLNNSAIASNVIVFRHIEAEGMKENRRPANTNCKARSKPTAVDDKENLDPTNILKPKNRRRPDKGFESSMSSKSDFESENDKGQLDVSSSENGFEEKVETAVATNKYLQQKNASLEKEVYELKLKLAKCEKEKEEMRVQCVKLIAEQKRLYSERQNQMIALEENYRKRKLSIIQSPYFLSPGRDYSPPRVCLENIGEDGEEEECDVGQEKIDPNDA